MHDTKFSSWPDPSLRRAVVRAEVEVADGIQGLYKLTIHDSAGNQHFMQLPSDVLRVFERIDVLICYHPLKRFQVCNQCPPLIVS